MLPAHHGRGRPATVCSTRSASTRAPSRRKIASASSSRSCAGPCSPFWACICLSTCKSRATTLRIGHPPRPRQTVQALHQLTMITLRGNVCCLGSGMIARLPQVERCLLVRGGSSLLCLERQAFNALPQPLHDVPGNHVLCSAFPAVQAQPPRAAHDEG